MFAETRTTLGPVKATRENSRREPRKGRITMSGLTTYHSGATIRARPRAFYVSTTN